MSPMDLVDRYLRVQVTSRMMEDCDFMVSFFVGSKQCANGPCGYWLPFNGARCLKPYWRQMTRGRWDGELLTAQMQGLSFW